MKYKILLVVPRRNSLHPQDFFPLGLAYISSTLKSAGYRVDVMNLNHLKGNSQEIISNCLDVDEYDFVCTGNTALGYRETESIINTARNHTTKPKTILGGVIISAETDIVFQAINPTFAVIGEGEETIIELLAYLDKGLDLRAVKGIMYRDDHGVPIKTTSREPIGDLDSIPQPDIEGLGFREELDNMYTNFSYYSTFFDYPRIYPILGSRSCPFHCTFCYHFAKYRKRTVKNIIEELRVVVKNYTINMIVFYDECFATERRRVLEFCEGINTLKKEIGWELKWTCQMRVESVDIELLRIMKDAGCCVISYGLESFSLDVLKSMKKGITPDQIDKALKNTVAENIGIVGLFIFGDIAETKETAQITLDYWQNNCKEIVILGLVRPYPGSAIFEHCVRVGLIHDKLDFIKNIGNKYYYGFNLNMTERMNDTELRKLRKKVMLLHEKYSNYARPLSIRRTGKNLYSYKAECPLCKSEVEYNNLYTVSKRYIFEATCRYCCKRIYIADRFHYLLNQIRQRHQYISKLLYFYRDLRNSLKTWVTGTLCFFF